MSINHNRIKVADLEKNEPDKILLTNTIGELEFKDISEIKADSYNALDYTAEGKALDARQGKALKDLIDTINQLLVSDNVNLNTIQKLGDAIETVQNSLSTILVNDLTTGGTTKALTAEMGKLLHTNKVDKAAGERLINTAEITKLSGLTNVTTTTKTILSTALVTQNVAGFVTYINSLNPVLVVGPNEVVKYTTSDTGRTFELNLRGRSFGVGQPAIVAANVIEITDFLNKDIRLSNYPSTRNDGVNPANKVLGTDANGNMKLYTIATLPAPHLREISPNFYLPSTTGNIIIKGSFFTPSMTVAIAGQTVNYVTFISDNEVHVNVTTGTTEGSFAITLNNGVSATFNNMLMIILGIVDYPKSYSWTNFLSTPNVSEDGGIKVSTNVSIQGADWKIIPANEDFRIIGVGGRSPFSMTYDLWPSKGNFQLISTTDGIIKFWMGWRCWGPGASNGGNLRAANYLAEDSGDATSTIAYGDPTGKQGILERKAGIWKFYVNGILIKTFAGTVNEELIIRLKIQNQDILGIKYVKLAT
ncbi:IPT/TIG domain-containing protein [Flavobacterium sp. RS13.1]|uniref:IPT/TIG domain-containing protein n=1 Tax=Flavobacterium sp. RS13.1 TaxID=3400345 RepID=UPI003AAF40C5